MRGTRLAGFFLSVLTLFLLLSSLFLPPDPITRMCAFSVAIVLSGLFTYVVKDRNLLGTDGSVTE